MDVVVLDAPVQGSSPRRLPLRPGAAPHRHLVPPITPRTLPLHRARCAKEEGLAFTEVDEEREQGLEGQAKHRRVSRMRLTKALTPLLPDMLQRDYAELETGEAN